MLGPIVDGTGHKCLVMPRLEHGSPSLGCLDFSFIRAKILSFHNAPELVGLEALLDVKQVDIGGA
jgi:hypothetical protein